MSTISNALQTAYSSASTNLDSSLQWIKGASSSAVSTLERIAARIANAACALFCFIVTNLSKGLEFAQEATLSAISRLPSVSTKAAMQGGAIIALIALVVFAAHRYLQPESPVKSPSAATEAPVPSGLAQPSSPTGSTGDTGVMD